MFVSSVIEGYEDFRRAARQGIEAADCEPVMVEDFPARATSPRNACVDGVASSDVYLGILGARAGSIAPSGMTVVEEEYEEARQRGKRVLILVEDIEREPRQEEFVQKVSDFVEGRFRESFTTADELRQKVEHSLRELDVGMNENREAAARYVMEKLNNGLVQAGEATVRIVLAPVRVEEVIELGRFDSEFVDRLLEIGRSRAVRLLEPRAAYKETQTADGVKIVYASERNWREPQSTVGLELTNRGTLAIEASVTNVTDRDLGPLGGASIIAEEDVELQLQRAFAFANTLYSDVDPYGRQHGFVYNAGLFAVEHRAFERNPQPRRSYTVRVHQTDNVVPYDEPRDISRPQLSQPGEEIDRLLVRWRRTLGEG